MLRKSLIPMAFSALLCGGAAEAGEVIQAVYSCERGVTIPVSYINTSDGNYVVLQAEGQQIALPQVVSGSGARYGGGNGYQWWSKGKTAQLTWFDPNAGPKEKGEEVTLFAFCETPD